MTKYQVTDDFQQDSIHRKCASSGQSKLKTDVGVVRLGFVDRDTPFGGFDVRTGVIEEIGTELLGMVTKAEAEELRTRVAGLEALVAELKSAQSLVQAWSSTIDAVRLLVEAKPEPEPEPAPKPTTKPAPKPRARSRKKAT